ncbi:MAG: hypothetical protein M3416_20990, partial [Acidobacteriota bacterium]|nr:hypothetical protein [Acidobacteriota bacterium]
RPLCASAAGGANNATHTAETNAPRAKRRPMVFTTRIFLLTLRKTVNREPEFSVVSEDNSENR